MHTVLTALLLSGGVHADVTIGVGGALRSLNCSMVAAKRLEYSGVFMSKDADKGGIGLHLGYTQSNASTLEGVSENLQIPIPGGMTSASVVYDANSKTEVKNIIDVLFAIRTKPSKSGISGLFMAGYSRAKIDVSSASRTSEIT